MNTPRRRLSSMLVRGWTRVYTLGLPVAARDRRRAEIESDLWESEHADAIGRLIRGVPSDLAWRIEQMDGSNRFHARLQFLTALGFFVVLIAWAIGALTHPELPPLPDRPAPYYVIRHRPPPPPPPPPPTWDDWVARLRTGAPDAKKTEQDSPRAR